VNGGCVDMQRGEVFDQGFPQRGKLGEAMRKVMIFLFAVAAVTLVATGAASAAPFPGAMCKAAGKASMISKVGCRIVRKCGYFGCSYEQVCT
jgi:hypothetical protein